MAVIRRTKSYHLQCVWYVSSKHGMHTVYVRCVYAASLLRLYGVIVEYLYLRWT